MNLLQTIAGAGAAVYDAVMPSSTQYAERVSPTSEVGWSDSDSSYGRPSFSTLVEMGFRSNPWVYACISRSVNTISSLPWRVLDGPEDDPTVLEAGNDAYDFFFSNNDPNLVGYGQTWPFRKSMRVLCTQLYIGGEVYPLRITGSSDNMTGVPRMWFPIKPNVIRPKGDAIGRFTSFEYTDSNGQLKYYQPEEMFQITYQTDPLDYMHGVSPLEAAARAAATNNYAEEWLNNILGRGDIPAVAWKSIYEQVNEDTHMAAWEALKNMLSKARRGRHLHVLSDVFEPMVLNMKPVDMKLSESQKDSRRAICAAFGVPPVIAGDMDEATYSNFEQAIKIHILRCMEVADMIADGFNLGVMKQFGPDVRIDYDSEAIEELREDANERSKREVAEVGAGIVTRGEIRERRGLDPKPGDDILTVDNRTTPLEDATMIANEERSNPITEE